MELVSHSAAVNCHLLTNLTVEHDENPLCVSFSPKCSVFWWEPVHSLVSSSREVAAYFNETGHPPFLHQGPLSQLASRQVGRVFERPKKIQLNLSLFHFAFPAGSACSSLSALKGPGFVRLITSALLFLRWPCRPYKSVG